MRARIAAELQSPVKSFSFQGTRAGPPGPLAHYESDNVIRPFVWERYGKVSRLQREHCTAFRNGIETIFFPNQRRMHLMHCVLRHVKPNHIKSGRLGDENRLHALRLRFGKIERRQSGALSRRVTEIGTVSRALLVSPDERACDVHLQVERRPILKCIRGRRAQYTQAPPHS